MLRAACAVLCLTGLASAEGLAGRLVQDHSGVPVASADAKLYRTGQPGLAADLESDSDGRFQADGLPPGEYRLEISKSGYINATLPVRIAAGETARPLLRLVRCGSIAGRVTDAAGRPLRPTWVFVMVRGPGGVLLPVRDRGTQASVDEGGRYRLYNLPPGEYVVAASYGASVSQVGSTSVLPPLGSTGSGALLYRDNARPQAFAITSGEEYRDIDFTVAPGQLFAVKGKVELPAPNSSFWVTLTPVDRPSLSTAVSPADDDGSFRLEGVAPGSYNLFAFGPITGYGGGGIVGADPQYARMRVDVAGQDVTGVVLSPRKGVPAAVRIKSASCKQASVVVTALEDWGARFERTVQATSEKDTTLADLMPARYQFTAQPGENCFQTEDAVVDLTGGEAPAVAVAMAPAGSIRGKLIGGKAADFAVVLVAQKTFAGQQAVRVALPDADGRFAFDALPAGEYRIAAHAAADSPRTRWMSADLIPVRVPGGAPTDVELPAVVRP